MSTIGSALAHFFIRACQWFSVIASAILGVAVFGLGTILTCVFLAIGGEGWWDFLIAPVGIFLAVVFGGLSWKLIDIFDMDW